MYLYTPDNKKFYILYTGGGSKVYILDVSNPAVTIELATLDQFTDV